VKLLPHLCLLVELELGHLSHKLLIAQKWLPLALQLLPQERPKLFKAQPPLLLALPVEHLQQPQVFLSKAVALNATGLIESGLIGTGLVGSGLIGGGAAVFRDAGGGVEGAECRGGAGDGAGGGFRGLGMGIFGARGSLGLA